MSSEPPVRVPMTEVEILRRALEQIADARLMHADDRCFAVSHAREIARNALNKADAAVARPERMGDASYSTGIERDGEPPRRGY